MQRCELVFLDLQITVMVVRAFNYATLITFENYFSCIRIYRCAGIIQLVFSKCSQFLLSNHCSQVWLQELVGS